MIAIDEEALQSQHGSLFGSGNHFGSWYTITSAYLHPKMPMPFHFTSMEDLSNDDQAVRALAERIATLSPDNNAEILRTMEEMLEFIAAQGREICTLKRQLQMLQVVPELAASIKDSLNSISIQYQARTEATGARVAALEQDVSRLKEGEQRQGTQFIYKPRELDGIIAFLTRECGGNVHKKGVVNVTASSCVESGNPIYGVDLLSDDIFHSGGEPNQWCCYDFKRRRVSLTSYTIRSYRPGVNHTFHCPLSWVVEVSNDNTNWQIVDSRENDHSLCAAHVIRNFSVRTVPDGSFRYVRLLQTGYNSSNTNYLVFCAFELFGTLSDE